MVHDTKEDQTNIKKDPYPDLVIRNIVSFLDPSALPTILRSHPIFFNNTTSHLYRKVTLDVKAFLGLVKHLKLDEEDGKSKPYSVIHSLKKTRSLHITETKQDGTSSELVEGSEDANDGLSDIFSPLDTKLFQSLEILSIPVETFMVPNPNAPTAPSTTYHNVYTLVSQLQPKILILDNIAYHTKSPDPNPNHHPFPSSITHLIVNIYRPSDVKSIPNPNFSSQILFPLPPSLTHVLIRFYPENFMMTVISKKTKESDKLWGGTLFGFVQPLLSQGIIVQLLKAEVDDEEVKKKLDYRWTKSMGFMKSTMKPLWAVRNLGTEGERDQWSDNFKTVGKEDLEQDPVWKLIL